VHITHCAASREEADERADAQAEVDDPHYLRDAEGEPDVPEFVQQQQVVRDRLVASGFDGMTGPEMAVDVDT
jgi:hypothetical protein